MIKIPRKWTIASLIALSGLAIALPFIMNMARAEETIGSILDGVDIVYVNGDGDPNENGVNVQSVNDGMAYDVDDNNKYYAAVKWSEKPNHRLSNNLDINVNLTGFYAEVDVVDDNNDIKNNRFTQISVYEPETGEENQIGYVDVTGRNLFQLKFTNLEQYSGKYLSGVKSETNAQIGKV